MGSSTVEVASIGASIGLTSSDVQQPVAPLRLCVSCANEIPANRLAARPNASRCVSCTVANGDVKPIKRFDETVGEDTVSTYFINNPRIEARIARMYKHVPNPRIMAEGADAPAVETKSTEQNAERRAGNMLTQLIADQPEEISEGD